MERKHFLTTVASATAGITAVAAAAMAATPMPNATPFPGFSAVPTRSPRTGSSIYPPNLHRHGAAGPTNLERIHRHLERLISMLEEYPQAHTDHVTQAISYLQQADTEIVTEMSTASPAPTL
ncbi:MAG: hypothetical protein JOZ91_09490 [Candidatus Eremiobacteraeota bacterium]|nr:hypothetical protein [Candidatus Eremiobacteraeota bacterium]